MSGQILPFIGNHRGRIYVPPPIPCDTEESCARLGDPWRSADYDLLSATVHHAYITVACIITSAAFLAGIAVGILARVP